MRSRSLRASHKKSRTPSSSTLAFRQSRETLHIVMSFIAPAPFNAPLLPLEEASKHVQDVWTDLKTYLQTSASSSTLEEFDRHLERARLEELVLIKESGGTLLHIACSFNAPTEIIKRLLAADENKFTISSRNKHGATPLHNICDAIFIEPPVESVQMLIDADSEHRTILAQTTQKDLPIHYACWRRQPLSVIKLLLDADHDKISIRAMNTHGRIPIETACHRNAPVDVIEHLLGYGNADPDYIWNALLIIECENMGEVVANTKELQDAVNDASTERLPVAVLLADGYAHCATIVAFLYESDAFLRSNTSNSVTSSMLYATMSYFIFREILQLVSTKGQYFRDGWNYLDIAKIGIVLASSVIMKDGRVSEHARNVLVAAGAFIFIGLVSYLRSTFLQFARFVNSILKIFRSLVPFFVISLIFLASFSFMYFVKIFDEGECLDSSCSDEYEFCVCSFWDVFPGVFTFIVSGLDGTTSAIDYLFGVVIAIVLLNVLIAIVNNEWNESSSAALRMFWHYRLSFLSEIRLLQKHLSFDLNNMSFGSLEKIDSLGWIEKRKNGILYYRMDYQWTDGTWCDRLKLVVIFLPLYYSLFVLGFFTFGLLWPSEIRRGIFSQATAQTNVATRGKAPH